MSAQDGERRSQLKLHGIDADVDAARDEVDRRAEEWDLPPAMVIEIQIALDEVISNIISHGYGDREDREIEIRMRVVPSEAGADAQEDLILDILDGAPPFSIFDVPAPDLTEDLDEREIGGLGIHLVKSLMDDVEYRRADERNHVTLRKRIAAEE